MGKTGYLVLENGKVFQGRRFGAQGEVLAEGVQGTDALTRELQEWVKSKTAPYKYPRIIEYVEELPRTVNGKIRRVAIREADQQPSVAEGLV